jgi:flagellar basal-body rod protein FlgB
MSGKIDEMMQFQQTALRLLEARQQLLASNVANADTPNYKARDIDFASALKQAVTDQGGKLPPTTTAPNHLGAASGQTVMGAPVQYRVPLQPSADGNTVNMDVERAQFADNAMRYQASLKFISDDIKGVLEALK